VYNTERKMEDNCNTDLQRQVVKMGSETGASSCPLMDFILTGRNDVVWRAERDRAYSKRLAHVGE
jgi:hypothetical protein